MWRFLGWLGGFVAAAIVSLIAAIAIRWSVYLYRFVKGR